MRAWRTLSMIALGLLVGMLNSPVAVGYVLTLDDEAPRPRHAAARQADLPIIDLHFHPEAGWDVAEFAALLDRLGVAAAGNGANGSGDWLALAFAQAAPGRVLPFGGQPLFGLTAREGAAAWNLQSRAVLAYLAELEDGVRACRFLGIGEVLSNNARSNLVGAPAIRFASDAPLMQDLWRMSAASGVPLSVHMEADAESVAGMERLLASDRAGTWLWSHAGFYAEPPELRRLFLAHPNLSAELSLREGPRGWPIALPITDRTATLRPEWRALLEEFPDRFVIGTDALVPKPAEYARIIAVYRSILDQLSPRAAAGLAQENAARLLTRPGCSDPQPWDWGG